MKAPYLTSIIIASALTLSVAAHAQNNSMRYYPQAQPITENMLLQHLNAQLNVTKQQLAFDKKQADIYAANFAQYQKRQAAALKSMMDNAEKQRQYTIKVMEMQQRNIMQQFSKYQIASDSKK